MMGLLRLWILLFVLNSCAGPESSKTSGHHGPGTVVRLPAISSDFISDRNVDVWLPDGYSTEKNYAVLYLHDGQMLFDSTATWNKQEWGVDEVVNRLIKSGAIQDVIVVGVWNDGSSRFIDYFPQKPFESLGQGLKDSILSLPGDGGGKKYADSVRSDRYLRFLVHELKPVIDAAFSTHTDRSNTFIGGSSMGGLISMYALCEYPEVFGGALCLSTHWIGAYGVEGDRIPQAFLAYLENHLPETGRCKWYFDHGTATLDSLYGTHQHRVDSLFKARGHTENDFMSKVFEGHDHTENSWRKRLHIPFTFILHP